jgi:hypothetical protein
MYISSLVSQEYTRVKSLHIIHADRSKVNDDGSVVPGVYREYDGLDYCCKELMNTFYGVLSVFEGTSRIREGSRKARRRKFGNALEDSGNSNVEEYFYSYVDDGDYENNKMLECSFFDMGSDSEDILRDDKIVLPKSSSLLTKLSVAGEPPTTPYVFSRVSAAKSLPIPPPLTGLFFVPLELPSSLIMGSFSSLFFENESPYNNARNTQVCPVSSLNALSSSIPFTCAIWDFLLVEILVRRRNVFQRRSNIGSYRMLLLFFFFFCYVW